MIRECVQSFSRDRSQANVAFRGEAQDFIGERLLSTFCDQDAMKPAASSHSFEHRMATDDQLMLRRVRLSF
jgi:hypothetical protein